jgi:siderophore synthetase component
VTSQLTAPAGPSAPVAHGADPLLDPDPARAADAATVEGLLRCWVRETGVTRPAGDVLELDLPATRVRLTAPVRYWSLAGWHRFGTAAVDGTGIPAGAATVALLLAREAAAGRDASPVAVRDLVARVLDSATRVAAHIEHRRAAPDDTANAFLCGEQALLLGHPLHPTPKSRQGLSDAQAAAYSPELRGSFPLHWFAADRSVIAADSALPRPAEDVVTALYDGDPSRLPPGAVAVPAHPWQARDVATRPGIRALLDAGLLHDLGPAGPPWYPTSSLRTVHRPGAPVMLKLSLGLRITNSRRENLRKELRRGVEVHRLLAAGLGAEMRRAYPSFDIVRDPAWLAVDAPGDREESGLEVVLRDSPFGVPEDVSCVAGLVAERPDRTGDGGRSHLAVLVGRLAERTGRPVPDVAADWFGRYLEAVAVPILALYATHGIALEAHHQNTLVMLDADGWPVGGRYRDNQGYYVAASRAGELARWLPRAGEAGDTICADAVCDSRLGYYLGVNNVLGLVGAFGSQGLADEGVLLSRLRRCLERLAHTLASPPEVVTTLLEAPTLGCKANLLTRLDGLDELVGPLETQSVYVEIANPLDDALVRAGSGGGS